MTTLQVHVGATFADTERPILGAVERHEAREDVTETHLTFENWRTFARVMTANRLELLRHVHRTKPRGTLALSKALGRNYKRVHEDVEALLTAGLRDRDATGLHARSRSSAQPDTGAIAPPRAPT